MPVPEFACEVSNAFRFVWTMGGEDDMSRKKHCESVIRPYSIKKGNLGTPMRDTIISNFSNDATAYNNILILNKIWKICLLE